MAHLFSAFSIPTITSTRCQHGGTTSPRRPRPILPPSASNEIPPPLIPTKTQMARLRFHLRKLRHNPSVLVDNDITHSTIYNHSQSHTESESDSTPRKKHYYSTEERKARSERLRQLWQDPTWRAAMMTRRKTSETQSRRSNAARKLWKDPQFRAKMRAARLGRPAPNKGVSASSVTRLRMSMSRKGVPVSETTRKKMSDSKLKRPDGDNWRKLISDSKKGKTKEYFQMRREFRALHTDLKLWSDSYRSMYGRLPSASTYERFVAPMMILRIKRYLTLKETIGIDEPDFNGEIIGP